MIKFRIHTASNRNSTFYFRWGKRSFEDGLMRPARATPLRWGKRSTDSQLYELYNKRAPLRWGKRAPSRYVLFHRLLFIMTTGLS